MRAAEEELTQLREEAVEADKHTAGLPISLTWGLRHNFCYRGPILIQRSVLEFPAQTTRVMLLNFVVKPKKRIFCVFLLVFLSSVFSCKTQKFRF